MQSFECVELLLFVLLPKMSVPDIKNLGLHVYLTLEMLLYSALCDLYI